MLAANWLLVGKLLAMVESLLAERRCCQLLQTRCGDGFVVVGGLARCCVWLLLGKVDLHIDLWLGDDCLLYWRVRVFNWIAVLGGR